MSSKASSPTASTNPVNGASPAANGPTSTPQKSSLSSNQTKSAPPINTQITPNGKDSTSSTNSGLGGVGGVARESSSSSISSGVGNGNGNDRATGLASALSPSGAGYGPGGLLSPGREGGNGEQTLTLRALVTTKEAGVIIGKGGKNVADLRDATGCKAGVSKVVGGVNDRILTVQGDGEGVGKAYSLVAQTILENPISISPPSTPVVAPNNTTTTIRLLISHNLMGSIIGKQGAKIKQIQDASGTRMVAGKEMLPQSTERIVEVHGAPDGIRIAVWEIGKCLLEDWERGQGTVLYHPGAVGPEGAAANTYPGGVLSNTGFGPSGRKISGSWNSASSPRTPRTAGPGGDAGSPTARRSSNPLSAGVHPAQSVPTPSDPSLRTQNISIPADMVGCIIGKGGSKINEIRRLSGSKISIAKDAHDDSMERMFTITGTPEANEKALFLLYNQLESEKERRMQSVQEGSEN